MRRQLLVSLSALALTAACAGKETPRTAQDSTVTSSSGVALTGAGATFPNPIYTKWFDA